MTYGPVTAKYSHSVTNLFGVANSKNSSYLDLSASFEVAKGWTLAPHVGHQKVAGNGNGIASYTDYSVAANYDYGNGVVVSAEPTPTRPST